MKRIVLIAILIGLMSGCGGGKKCPCGVGEVTKTYWAQGVLVTTRDTWACMPCVPDFEVN